MIEALFSYFNQDYVIRAMVDIGSMALFFVGLFGLLTQRHILKIFMSISVMEIAVFLFFIGSIFNKTFTAPILGDGHTAFTAMNDPIPHAMILTAIVIGMAVFALGVSFAIEYYKVTGKTDINDMNEMREK
ncbi:putative Na(+) H(+) antiporter subunit C [hydrothermal vent metagenome]|uniref:Putative Na(+) H(+) antiporter subunit C n=1 Tax=hydrothermal vent metagenome TaxID=652676 RepID=A0A1W1EE08_9ZZZZ